MTPNVSDANESDFKSKKEMDRIEKNQHKNDRIERELKSDQGSAILSEFGLLGEVSPRKKEKKKKKR